MAKVNQITDLIGNTPLVKINKLNDSDAEVYVKVEAFNPLGSVKDRAALAMIETAERDGSLKKGSVIIKPTSGNTGIGLAYVAAVGYRIILTMPDTMSIARRLQLLKAFGAELVLNIGDIYLVGRMALHAVTPTRSTA